MPSVYDLKPQFQQFLRPVCSKLARYGITANQVTAIALGLSVAHGVWIWMSGASDASLTLLPLTLFIRMAMNAIDGMLAREFDMESRFGAVFNELADVLSDAALYLPFMICASPILVAITVVLAVVAEMAGAIAPLINSPRQYQGPLAKATAQSFLESAEF